MSYAIILDVSGGEFDGRVRREYERRLPRLDRRYVYDWRNDVVRALAHGEDANEILAAEGGDLSLLFFEPRTASAHFIGGHYYMRVNGQDQILGYSIKAPETLDRLLERVYLAAHNAVEKARKRERARRRRVAVAS
jgi:hypothetical protein